MAEITYKFAHVGINSENAEQALKMVELLGKAFGLPSYDVGSSVIVGGPFEILKSEGPGTLGHIAMETPDVAAAIQDLEAKGFAVEEKSIQRLPDGRVLSAYLQQEIGGFAFHLLQSRSVK